jgi:pimeloyl-ACP methyl ester carboxylesterase
LPSAPALARVENAAFEPVACNTFDIAEHAPGAVEGDDVACGFLIVPESRDEPDGKTIKLGVVIIKSTADNPAPDPLILTQGGPGGSGIELFAFLADPSNTLGQTFRANRDLIAFEQRGTRYSEPFLFCDEAFEEGLGALEQQLSDEEDARLALDAYEACRARFEADGINLAAYNSFENAADVATLAEVLGYEQINFYGVSYGTMLGQHLMRLRPNPNQEAPASKNRSFSLLFEACAADPDCNRYYPDLEQVLFDTVAQLNQSPARIALVDLETQQGYNVVIDGDDLIGLVTQLFYVTEAIPALPNMIYEARAGEFDLAQLVLGLLIFDRSQADGMYMSVMCAEDFDFQVDELDLTGVRPEFAADEKTGTEITLQICTNWAVPQLGPLADEPVASDIPTLLFSGNFDPITPPVNGETMARILGNAYNFTFPINGHGAFLGGECPTQIMRDFLNDPDVEPDARCISDPAAPEFFTPANTLMSPGATFLLKGINRFLANPADPENIRQVVVPLAAPTLLWFGLLLFPLVWFVGWLGNLLRKKPGDKRWLARLAPWVGVLLTILVFAFAGLLLVSVGAAEFAGIFAATAGISRSFAWIFILPWLIASAAVLMVGLAVISWTKRYWGLPARIYYSLTALLALIYTVSLINFDLMTVLLS